MCGQWQSHIKVLRVSAMQVQVIRGQASGRIAKYASDLEAMACSQALAELERQKAHLQQLLTNVSAKVTSPFATLQTSQSLMMCSSCPMQTHAA